MHHRETSKNVLEIVDRDGNLLLEQFDKSETRTELLSVNNTDYVFLLLITNKHKYERMISMKNLNMNINIIINVNININIIRTNTYKNNGSYILTIIINRSHDP